MIHESIQHISAAGFYLCRSGRGGESKELQTKEVQMRRAEMTAVHLVLMPADSRAA